MINDKKFLTYLKYQLIILIVSLLMGASFIFIVNKSYESEVVNMKRSIAANLIIKDDILDILVNDELTKNEIDEILLENNLYDLAEYKGFIDLSSSNKLVKSYIYIMILIINFVYIALSLARYFSEKKRMDQINIYMNKVLSNDFSLDIREFDDDSLASLKNDIYKITTKLRFMSEYSINEKKNLEETLSDISHQLKTPLTSMFVINTILEDELSNDVRLNFLKKNRQQLDKLDWLIKSLLKMSQIDSGTIPFNKEKTSVTYIVNKAINDHLIPIELKHINLNIEDFKDDVVYCDISWTIEAISNILKNAIEHTPFDGSINISMSKTSFSTTISIEDTGCGMSEEELVNVFKRFYKKDKSTDGIGIGMNISKTIMNRQNGDVKVESIKDVGTTFKVIIN